jgi:hypothetical protein
MKFPSYEIVTPPIRIIYYPFCNLVPFSYLRTFFVTCSPFIYLSIYGTVKPLSDIISKLGDVNRSSWMILKYFFLLETMQVGIKFTIWLLEIPQWERRHPWSTTQPIYIYTLYVYLSIYGTVKHLSDIISKLGDVNRSSSLIVLELTVKNRPSPRHLFWSDLPFVS